MEKINLNDYLASNEYPGRGIAVAMAPDGRQMFIGYFIMGRSENSRNRVFDPVPERGGICTMAADPDKLEDPSLIIYNPVLTLGKTHIVTNGDQTDTVRDFLAQGKGWLEALCSRTFEPDAPNWTPRISGLLGGDGSYKLSILRAADPEGQRCIRCFYEYEPAPGEGRFISTYEGFGSPLPSFSGEPVAVEVPELGAVELARRIWGALNEANRVSLYTCVDGVEAIINKYEEEA